MSSECLKAPELLLKMLFFSFFLYRVFLELLVPLDLQVLQVYL